MKWLDIIVEKATSGRFWLTIITGFAFNWAIRNKVLSPEATSAIITAVFMSYFQRNRNGGTK